MSVKKTVIQVTQREKDIFDFVALSAKGVLGGGKKRTCIPPAVIRDNLVEKYPEIKAFHVTASQKNLEALGLITRIVDAGCQGEMTGVRNPSTFEINDDFYANAIIEIISKRKSGYPAGAYKKPPVTIDKTKTTLKRAKDLVAKKKLALDRMGKDNLALRKKIIKQEADMQSLKEDIQVIADLLAIKRRNLKKLGIIVEESR